MKCKAAENLSKLRGIRLSARALRLLAWLTPGVAAAQTSVVSVPPDADAFVWSISPTDNYGAAGALSVSGSAAVNGSGQQNGLFDTLMRFPLSNVVASLNGTLGPGNWSVIRCRLIVNETATPDNAIFGRGVGAFRVLLLASNNWLEGTGRPIAPTTDGVTWNDLGALVNSNVDCSLGIFTNAGVDGQISFELALAAPFLADIGQGGLLSLHLTAVDPGIGFTFNSRNFGNTNAQPMLEVMAGIMPRLQIDKIGVGGDYVAVSFAALPNWTYQLQASSILATSASNWADLMVIPPQIVASNFVYHDGITNQQRFYRLLVSP